MAEGLNRVLLLGNLGADPELKVTQGGQAVLKLRLATTESYLDKNQARQERTEWHSVTLWGRRGEALAKFLAKGERIFVEGRLQTSSYEKDGEKRYRTEVIATNIILAGRGKAGDQPFEGGGDREPRRYAPGGGGGGGGGGGYDRAERSGGAPAQGRGRSGPGAGGGAGGGGGGGGGGEPPPVGDPGFDDYGSGGDDEIPF